MTQQRALRTRAAVIAGAATEFALHGYVGASVNRIIESTTVTKGAMYFHFPSKGSMAEAILDNAAAVYAAIANRWITVDGVHPFDAIAGMVDDAAQGLRRGSSVACRSPIDRRAGVRPTPAPLGIGRSGIGSRRQSG